MINNIECKNQKSILIEFKILLKNFIDKNRIIQKNVQVQFNLIRILMLNVLINKIVFLNELLQEINFYDLMGYIVEINIEIKLVVNENKSIKEVHIEQNQILIFFDHLIALMQEEVNKIKRI